MSKKGGGGGENIFGLRLKYINLQELKKKKKKRKKKRKPLKTIHG